VFKIIDGNSHGLADARAFIDLLNRPPDALRGYFGAEGDVIVTRAPGRLDVMGGIADYSGSLVLPMPIAEATFAAIQQTGSDKIEIVSLSVISGKPLFFELSLDSLPEPDLIDYALVHGELTRFRPDRWASYAAGVFYVLSRELGVRFKGGARTLISSRVPFGKGVSSSAAIEVAVMRSVCEAYEIEIDDRTLALLCQKVENEIVGAACGVMDQVASNCGVENALVSLICQPAEIGKPINIPDGIEFWGIDSGVRHAVAGSDYTSVRVGAFMGYRIIADLAGLKYEQIDDGLVSVEDDRWHGYLANVSVDEYDRDLSAHMPDVLTGTDFLARYGGTTDSVTAVRPDITYAVRAPAEHAIYESSRVATFQNMLGTPITGQVLSEMGSRMFGSHQSYAACGLTESRTDRIVELVSQRRENGLFGARITGGGSGGTVVVLARKGSRRSIGELANTFEAETGHRPYIFHGSSPGCSTFGYLRLRHQTD